MRGISHADGVGQRDFYWSGFGQPPRHGNDTRLTNLAFERTPERGGDGGLTGQPCGAGHGDDRPGRLN